MKLLSVKDFSGKKKRGAPAFCVHLKPEVGFSPRAPAGAHLMLHDRSRSVSDYVHGQPPQAGEVAPSEGWRCRRLASS